MQKNTARNSIEYHKILFEEAPHGIVFHDAEGIILSANPAAEQMLGLSSEKLKGRSSTDSRWRARHADGSPFPGEYHPAMLALRSGTPIRNSVMGVFNPTEGCTRWLQMSATPLFQPGEARPYQVMASFVDITEIRRLNTALEVEKVRFESITSAIAGVVYQFLVKPTGDWVFTFISESIKDLFGVQAAEVLEDHNTMTGRIHPEDRADHRASVELAVKNGSYWKHEHRIYTPTGEMKWIWGQARSQPQADGGILWSGYLVDITARKRSENLLQQSEEMHRIVANFTYDWEYWITPEGELPFCSPSCERVTGYRAEAFLEDPKLLIRVVHPDDRAMVLAHLNDQQRSDPLQRCQLPDFRIQTRSGEERWIAHTCQGVFAKDGTHLGSRGTHRDVTDRKLIEDTLAQSEQKFTEVAKSMPGVIFQFLFKTDGTSYFTYLSPKVTEIFGFPADPLAQVYGLNEGINPEDREAFLASVQESIERMKDWHFEGRFITPKGPMWFQGYARPMPQPDGILLNGILLDITARKEIESDLARTLEHLRLSHKAGRAAAWEWDLSTGENTWFEPLWELYGLDRNEVEPSYETWLQVVHPDDRETISKVLQEAVASGSDLDFQWRAVRPDGTTRWLLSRGQPLRDSNGNISHYLGIVLDITDRKRAEDDLLLKNQILTMAHEIAGMGHIVGDVATERWEGSPTLDAICGIGPAFDRTYAGWLTLVHPEDRDRVLSNMLQSLEKRERFVEEHRIIRPKDGEERWVAAWAEPKLDANGTPVQQVGLIQDITARKSSDAAIREGLEFSQKFLGALPLGFGVYHAESGQCVMANEQLAAMVGAPKEILLRHNFRSLPPWQESGMLASAELALAEDVLVDLETLIKTSFGTTRWFRTKFTSFESRRGKHLMIMVDDTTDRKHSAQLLEASREQLSALVQRLHRVQEEDRVRVSRMVHDELGQLLTSLKMDLNWLERRLSEPGLPPSLNPLLERAVGATELADAMITSVKGIAADLRPVTLDHLGLSAALKLELGRFADRSGLRATFMAEDISPRFPLEIETELFYIFRELLTNIARHAYATRVEVHWRAEAGMVLLEVGDDGVGLGQVMPSLSRSLGLLGMQERAAQCGGTIAFEPNQPRGLRVRVRIPCGSSLGERKHKP